MNSTKGKSKSYGMVWYDSIKCTTCRSKINLNTANNSRLWLTVFTLTVFTVHTSVNESLSFVNTWTVQLFDIELQFNVTESDPRQSEVEYDPIVFRSDPIRTLCKIAKCKENKNGGQRLVLTTSNTLPMFIAFNSICIWSYDFRRWVSSVHCCLSLVVNWTTTAKIPRPDINQASSTSSTYHCNICLQWNYECEYSYHLDYSCSTPSKIIALDVQKSMGQPHWTSELELTIFSPFILRLLCLDGVPKPLFHINTKNKTDQKCWRRNV